MSIKSNSIWNLTGTGLPLVIGVFAIPFLIEHIGVEAFGILTLVWMLIGYFSLFDFGLGRALTQQIATLLVSERTGEIPTLVKSGLSFTVIAGVLGGLGLAAFALPLGREWLNISPALQEPTTFSLFIAAVGIPMTTAATGLRGVLEAYEEFKSVNILRALLGAANFGLPVLSVLIFGTSLPYLVATLVLARAIVLAAYLLLVNRKLDVAWLSMPSRTGDKRRLLSFGAWMTVSNIISPLMVSADRLLIAAVLGASTVAYYTVPFEMLIRILVLPAALTGALFPRLAATLIVNVPQALGLYKRSLIIVAGVLGGLCTVIALGSHWGLNLWLGSEFAQESWIIVSVLSVGILLNGIAFVPFTTIQAAGDARTTAILHVLEFVIYVPVLLMALHSFGLVGAAIAWVSRVALDLVLLLAVTKRWFARRMG
jgi:O-antigen/teichoic acid export membrane protein